MTYLADLFADRFASNIATRWYDRTELDVFAERVGVTGAHSSKRGFVKLGERAHTLDHEEYFSLASHIARTLDIPEAELVFDALATLFDDLAPPDTASDGPYVKVPEPPCAPGRAALPALIWAASGTWLLLAGGKLLTRCCC